MEFRAEALELLKAPALIPGDTIAIVAPAGPPDPAALEQGVRFLTGNGFSVRIGDHVLDRSGYLAGSDRDRAADFNRMIQDPDVRAIFCARGGYGSARIVSSIDYDALKRDPKIIVGFSDITTILAAIWKECRLISFHGPMIGNRSLTPWSARHLLCQITGDSGATHPWPSPANSSERIQEPYFDIPEPVTGRLFGGCLSILVTLTGTPWDLPRKDSPYILFIEDIGEAPYRIDRMMTHLQHAGWFNRASGILAGEFTGCNQRPDDPEPTPDTHALLETILRSLHVPFWTNLKFGHDPDTLTLPFGATIRMDHNGITQTENVVERRMSSSFPE